MTTYLHDPVTGRPANSQAVAHLPIHSRLDVRVVRAAELTEGQLSGWLKIQGENSDLASPFFHPSYTQAVAKVRADVLVAIAYVGDEPTAFLPFQSAGAERAAPVGGRLNDFHGVITRAESPVSLSMIVSAAGLKSYSYHGLLSNVEVEGTIDQYPSPYVDTADGYEAFLTAAKKQSSTIRRHGQKLRALERDIGPVRLDHDVRDPDLLEHLICLKRNKYARMNAFDVLSVPWCANLLREVYATNEHGFRGVLSGLYAGDRLVAAHLGIQQGAVLQYWFPAFDPQYSKYSPGTQMILDVVKTASAEGVTTIDLSYGPEDFRYRGRTRSWTVARGEVQFSPLRRQIVQARYQLQQVARNLPFREVAKRAVRSLVPSVGSSDYR